jgi:hypothetical protein
MAIAVPVPRPHKITSSHGLSLECVLLERPRPSGGALTFVARNCGRGAVLPPRTGTCGAADNGIYFVPTVLRKYDIVLGEDRVAVRDAATALMALIEYLRIAGCRDEDIVRLGTHSVAWRGAVYSARRARTDPSGNVSRSKTIER